MIIKEPLTQSQVFDWLAKLRAATIEELNQYYFDYLDVTSDTEEQIKAIIKECHRLGLVVSWYKTEPNKVLKIANMSGLSKFQKSFIKLNENEVMVFADTLLNAEIRYLMNKNINHYFELINDLKRKSKSKHLINCCKVFLSYNIAQIELLIDAFKQEDKRKENKNDCN